MKFILLFLVSVSLYIGVRHSVWVQAVSSKYMVAHYETTRCNKYLAAKATDGFICPYDKLACKKADKLWADYEESRLDYKNHRWTKYLKNIIKNL